MFDTISVSDKLPFSQEMLDLGITNNSPFQTKDFDCTMDEYVIQNGELFIQKYAVQEWVNGDPRAKFFTDRLGYMRREEPFLEKINHHGLINFYDFKYDVSCKWDCWIEFQASFSYGKLDKIELFKFEKTDNAERKQRESEWASKLARSQKLWRNKYLFYTSWFHFLERKWIKFWTNCANLCNKIAYLR